MVVDKKRPIDYIDNCADLLVDLQSALKILLKRQARFGYFEPAVTLKVADRSRQIKRAFLFCFLKLA